MRLRQECADLVTPSLAKRWGRRVQLREGWADYRLRAMGDALAAKFTQNPELGQALLTTGEARLVEGNTWGDTYWGVYRGRGDNQLGRLLMGLRSLLREAS
jgi:ribA/ribD-fused uncharacterized protein